MREWLYNRERPPVTVVVGAGSWGTTVATHLAGLGVPTTLLARREEQARAMRDSRHNPEYLRDLRLPEELEVGVLSDHDFSRAQLIVLAVPSKAFAATVQALSPRIQANTGVLSLTKGIDPSTGRRLSEVLQKAWASWDPHIAVLSGPNHAEEVSQGQPTATVIASEDEEFAAALQEILSSESFRPYRTRDVVGVELAAAVKNVIALATGMGDGLGFGDNARAALITRGLAEMSRLGEALGANPLTFAGLAGMGDLIATCTSRHSRNRRAGELMAEGHAPRSIESELGMVAEGLTAAPAVLALAKRVGVEMPITENVVSVIRGEKEMQESVRDLMGRPSRPERH